MEFLVIAVVIGLLPAIIAKNKGYSFGLWWFFGAAVFIVALPLALIMKPDSKAIEQSKLSEGMKKCPFCAELIKQEASVCRYCGQPLNKALRAQTPQHQTRRPPPLLPKGPPKFHVARDGSDLGQFSVAEIKGMISGGQLTMEDYYFDAEANEWMQLDCLPALV